MACDAMSIPKLSFPRNEIIEIIPASYQNEAKRIFIPGLPQEIVPASPEDLKIPVPPSGFVSPMTGLGTPQNGPSTPAGVKKALDPTSAYISSALANK